MKNLISLILCMSLFATGFAIQPLYGDLLILNNDKSFQGKVLNVKDCQVKFRAGGKSYWIPLADVKSLELATPAHPRWARQLDPNDPDSCLKGKVDGESLYKRGSLFILWGFLIGLIGVIVAAVSAPTPQKDKNTVANSENQDLFDDPDYLECYRKAAKKRNLLNAIIGWALAIALLALINSANA